MNPVDTPMDSFSALEGTVAFRLFADQVDPMLSVSEQIAGRIGDRILGSAVAPGERIGEQELADEFSVSRGPIREALRILEREGLVTMLPRRGAIVTELDASELRELMEVRAGLFEVVIRKLVNCTHPEFLPMLKAGTQRLHSLATLPDDGGQYAETTYRLLILCARMAGNKRLQRMLTGLSLQTLRYSKLGLASVERRIRSAALWQQATDAQESGNTELVVRLIHQRIDESAEEAIRVLDQKAAGKGAPV